MAPWWSCLCVGRRVVGIDIPGFWPDFLVFGRRKMQPPIQERGVGCILLFIVSRSGDGKSCGKQEHKNENLGHCTPSSRKCVATPRML